MAGPRIILRAGDLYHSCAPPRVRRAWWRDPLTYWRPFRDARQLRPAVWVAGDLSTYVASARESMGLHDPFEQRDADGVMRRYRRCTVEVWSQLRSEHAQTPALERLRLTLAAVHNLEALPVPCLNAQAAA